MTDLAPPQDLAGLRVLIVDDEALVAMMLEDMLGDLGCVIAGVAGRVSQALELLADPHLGIDVAVLDVNVAGDSIAPVAEAAVARGVGLVFATGYGESGVPDGFKGRPVLQKPFGFNDVAARLATAAGR